MRKLFWIVFLLITPVVFAQDFLGSVGRSESEEEMLHRQRYVEDRGVLSVFDRKLAHLDYRTRRLEKEWAELAKSLTSSGVYTSQSQ